MSRWDQEFMEFIEREIGRELNDRQRELLLGVHGSDGPIEAHIPAMKRKPRVARKVKALFMFGPSHGKSFFVTHPAPELLYTVDDDPPLFMAVEYPRDIGRNRLSRHHYRRLNEYSSAQGEDCALYVHDENCCDKTFPAD
ncbi:hypothetical protein SEA_AIKOY__97 [Mycobacterium phage Aikoy]|uniref:Uncharacterized protein n=1 Tax=Mycobacterium phage Onyinye TaxID=2686235 RepID=A0A6B9LDF9_9CAUD|nr:hypothetical protein PP339_gp096 [Mycobacterium phage Onyinye]QHB37511.1 hypothetical protein SEA_ONYINYE_96 [Mycobacterium phage Onyinye]WKW85259.1 hypothetical protein SEA_AIKOY__97 [Mycobacterium phage Aikoy]